MMTESKIRGLDGQGRASERTWRRGWLAAPRARGDPLRADGAGARAAARPGRAHGSDSSSRVQRRRCDPGAPAEAPR